MPVNADGIVIDADSIPINIGAGVIMLAVEPDSYLALNEIFASPVKEARQAQIDDKSLSFNEKWNSLADCFMNAADFLPENEWAHLDSRIQDVDPRQPPISPWTGEQLRKHFRTLKTKFALVDECFCRSGNLGAGADIDEADRFDFLMTLWKCKHCFFLLFGLLIRNLPSLFQGQNQSKINLIHLHLHRLHLQLVRNLRPQLMQKHWHKLCLH